MKIIYTQRELEDITIKDITINFVRALHARGYQYPDGSSAYVTLPKVSHRSECEGSPCTCRADVLHENLCKALDALVSVEKYSGHEP